MTCHLCYYIVEIRELAAEEAEEEDEGIVAEENPDSDTADSTEVPKGAGDKEEEDELAEYELEKYDEEDIG